MGEHLLFEVGLALGIIAAAGLLASRLRFSIVPILIIAGMAVGPHAPHIGMFDFRFIESAPLINFMGRLGVLFLLFYLGLEFSVGRLIKAGRSIFIGGTIYMVINFTLGIAFPLLWGWPLREVLVVPFRDFFGALFFFSFGLSIDPLALTGAFWPALGAVGITIAGNFISGLLAGRKSGYSHRASTNVGLTIISRGEFSIILANLAKAGGLLPILQPFAALYVLILAIIGPLLTKESKWIYSKMARIFKWPPLKDTDKLRQRSLAQ
ncbi:MAG: hypothetical protein VR69_01290 [Peptococcaceae bacterium BRH_c4b]|nr:MAG: hypothetical protein VR69_01290 [Peptococcaceae bacterium BRH_c4b]